MAEKVSPHKGRDKESSRGKPRERAEVGVKEERTKGEALKKENLVPKKSRTSSGLDREDEAEGNEGSEERERGDDYPNTVYIPDREQPKLDLLTPKSAVITFLYPEARVYRCPSNCTQHMHMRNGSKTKQESVITHITKEHKITLTKQYQCRKCYMLQQARKTGQGIKQWGEKHHCPNKEAEIVYAQEEGPLKCMGCGAKFYSTPALCMHAGKCEGFREKIADTPADLTRQEITHLLREEVPSSEDWEIATPSTWERIKTEGWGENVDKKSFLWPFKANNAWHLMVVEKGQPAQLVLSKLEAMPTELQGLVEIATGKEMITIQLGEELERERKDETVTSGILTVIVALQWLKKHIHPKPPINIQREELKARIAIHREKHGEREQVHSASLQAPKEKEREIETAHDHWESDREMRNQPEDEELEENITDLRQSNPSNDNNDITSKIDRPINASICEESGGDRGTMNKERPTDTGHTCNETVIEPHETQGNPEGLLGRANRAEEEEDIEFQKELESRGIDQELFQSNIGKVANWFYALKGKYGKKGGKFEHFEWITKMLALALHDCVHANSSELDRRLIRKTLPEAEEVKEMYKPTNSAGKGPRTKKRLDLADGPGLIKAFKASASKTVDQILGKYDSCCSIHPEVLYKHFKEVGEGEQVSDEAIEKLLRNIEPLEQLRELQRDPGRNPMRDFSKEELKKLFAKVTDTTPGPDGLAYSLWRKLSPDMEIVQWIVNQARIHRKIPRHWKVSRTILLDKGAKDKSKCNAWRPIALMNTIYKVYSGLWNNRIRAVDGVISACQKGFQKTDGTGEHIFQLRTAIDHAKTTGGNICVTWLDITNAFGTVPHKAITKTLCAGFGFSMELYDIITDLYEGATTEVVSSVGVTPTIPLKAGTKQGDPISPTLFNIVLELLIRAHELRAEKYEFLGSEISMLVYADDMVIVTKSPEVMQKQVDDLAANAKGIGLRFNPKKCASLTLLKGRVNDGAKIYLEGGKEGRQEFECLKDQETSRYLGVEMGAHTFTSIGIKGDVIISEIQKITDKNLNLPPSMKLSAIQTYILPKWTYVLTNAVPRMEELYSVSSRQDEEILKALNVVTKGKVRPSLFISLPQEVGGLGIITPSTYHLVLVILSVLKKGWSPDDGIRDLTKEYMRFWAQRKMDPDDIIYKHKRIKYREALDYMNRKAVVTRANGQTTIPRATTCKNLLDRCRQAMALLTHNPETRQNTKNASNPQLAPLAECEFVTDEGELALKIRSYGGEHEVTICKKYNSKDSLKVVKRVLQEGWKNKLIESTKYTDSIFKTVVLDPQNSYFLKNPRMLQVASHRFIYQARLLLVDLRGETLSAWKKKTLPNYDDTCALCTPKNLRNNKGGEQARKYKETLCHVLNHCHRTLSKTMTERHNAILEVLRQAFLLGNKKDYQWGMEKTPSDIPSILKPDLFIQEKGKKELVFVDVTVAFESDSNSLAVAEKAKIDKYQHFVQAATERGYKEASVHALVVGSLGCWHRNNDKTLKALGVDEKFAKLLRPIMQTLAINWARYIYWSHVYERKKKLKEMEGSEGEMQSQNNEGTEADEQDKEYNGPKPITPTITKPAEASESKTVTGGSGKNARKRKGESNQKDAVAPQQKRKKPEGL